ncbi:hypothetical protein [Nonomuraea longicatena]|uniref:Uncharacterized protein n=1 Tax=Nonomuraea longicatena TaxID=83682 RepID=A0ABP4B1H9_9ACTN
MIVLLVQSLPTTEGVAAARGVLSLLAVFAFWAMVVAVRQLGRVVTVLLRLLLLAFAVTAFGALAVAVVAQFALGAGLR